MIYPVTMYAGRCDNCGREVELGGGDYSAYGEKSSVEFDMDCSGWHIEKGKTDRHSGLPGWMQKIH